MEWNTEPISILRQSPPQDVVVLVGLHLVCSKISFRLSLPVLDIEDLRITGACVSKLYV